MVYTYGDFSIKGILPGIGMTLEAVGPITPQTTEHSVLILGEAARGPTDLVGLTTALSASAYYDQGDLKNGIEDCFGEGAPRVFAKRVSGSGTAKASVSIYDDQVSPNLVAKAYAKSPGAWGNRISCIFTQGVIPHAEQNYFDGDGLGGFYATEQAGFMNPQQDGAFISVGGVERQIVYSQEDLATGKVFLDCDVGRFKFYVGEDAEESDQITYSLWYYGVDCLLTDNESTDYGEDLKDLLDIKGFFLKSSLGTLEIQYGMTHLPVTGTRYPLTGGSDGSPITAQNWATALMQCSNELKKLDVVPTTTVLCAWEVQAGTYDLHTIASQWSTSENTQFRPTVIFVPTAPGEDPDQMVIEGMKRSNRHMAIVYPSWDESETRKNLAVLHAARTAWAPFGESVAADENRLKGANGLYGDLEDTINDDYVRSLTTRGIYVVVKTKAGVGPVKGVTTDKLDQFSRVVDQVTANRIIVRGHDIMTPYLNRRNDAETRDSMKLSIDAMMRALVEHKALYTFVSSCTQDTTNPNMVHFLLKFIPMGHIEWIDVSLKMGPFTDLTQFANV